MVGSAVRVRVQATEVFPNCPRYIHEYQLVKRSRFVPKRECETPVPQWKQSEWAHDVLPENDPANDRRARSSRAVTQTSGSRRELLSRDRAVVGATVLQRLPHAVRLQGC